MSSARFQRDEFGEVIMNPTLYKFADAYFNSTGKHRTYKAAAIAAGSPERSAHTAGCQWAQLPCVRRYWAQLDIELNRYRRSLHKKVLDELVDLALAKISAGEEWQAGATILEQVLKSSETAFSYRDIELSIQRSQASNSAQTSAKEDPVTLSTLDQIAVSLAHLAANGVYVDD